MRNKKLLKIAETGNRQQETERERERDKEGGRREKEMKSRREEESRMLPAVASLTLTAKNAAQCRR